MRNTQSCKRRRPAVTSFNARNNCWDGLLSCRPLFFIAIEIPHAAHQLLLAGGEHFGDVPGLDWNPLAVHRAA
jgi:hypothetical protein